MENVIKIEVLKGFAVALIASAFSFYIYVEHFSNYTFDETLKIINNGQLLGKLITLSALPNMIVFFIFLKKKQEYRARGVLLALFLFALTIAFLQLF